MKLEVKRLVDLELVGDPGRVHSSGLEVREVIESARERVASFFSVKSRQIIFTSSGTESNAIAIFSALANATGKTVIVSKGEHSSVKLNVETFGKLFNKEIVDISLDQEGHANLGELIDSVEDAIKTAKGVALVCLQLVNHEVGTLQDIEGIINVLAELNVPLMVDASSAVGHVDKGLLDISPAYLSISGHKLGALQGVGALIVKKGLTLQPLLKGGSQERNRRPGIENLFGIHSLGVALDELSQNLDFEIERSRNQTTYLIEKLSQIEDVEIFGSLTKRASHIVALGVNGIEAEPILLALDQRGIAVHSGSSCSSETLEPSPILESMGKKADSSLRVSVGWTTNISEIDYFLESFLDCIEDFKKLRKS